MQKVPFCFAVSELDIGTLNQASPYVCTKALLCAVFLPQQACRPLNARADAYIFSFAKLLRLGLIRATVLRTFLDPPSLRLWRGICLKPRQFQARAPNGGDESARC